MSRVTLRFVGSGDAFGSGGRLQACLALDGPGGTLLLDCGASSLIGLKRAGIDPRRVGWVIVTHLHGDHFGGLPFLVLDGQFDRRSEPLVVAGPPGMAARVEAAMEALFPGSARATRRFGVEFVDLEERSPRLVGPVTVTAYGVRHASGAPSYALRVEYAGAVVAYSGDTEWTDELIDAARGADLFVCEAYFFEKRVPHHLDYRTLLAHSSRLQCRRIMLTHMHADMLARRGDSQFTCAEDGQLVVLSGGG